MNNELDKQKVLKWAENKRDYYDFNHWFSKFVIDVSKGSFDSNRVAELEEQLKQAVGLLNELDAYFDFSEPIEQGDFIEFQDPSGINAVISKIREFISQGTEVKP